MNKDLGRAEMLNNAGRVGQCCACCCQGNDPEGMEAKQIFQGRRGALPATSHHRENAQFFSSFTELKTSRHI